MNGEEICLWGLVLIFKSLLNLYFSPHPFFELANDFSSNFFFPIKQKRQTISLQMAILIFFEESRNFNSTTFFRSFQLERRFAYAEELLVQHLLKFHRLIEH